MDKVEVLKHIFLALGILVLLVMVVFLFSQDNTDEYTSHLLPTPVISEEDSNLSDLFDIEEGFVYPEQEGQKGGCIINDTLVEEGVVMSDTICFKDRERD